ncbi:MAG: twin-arginine translocation signal domain-containing protein [Chloroflexi bacterium]|nr:twin-arginine translocation signal domain-containing protein [Chloroflexota bacterium]
MFNHPKRARLTRRDFLKLSGILAGGAAAQAAGVFETVAASPSFQAAVKKIYLAADDHTDYMWTGDEAAYKTAFLEMIDYYLNLADSTLGNAPEHQSRWNCDGSFWMWTYEKNRTATQFQRFINRLKSGHLSVPLNTLVSCYGGAPAEAVLRGMYYPGQIERRYNLRFTLAVAMENQTLPYGLGALWAGAGAKYSWRGVCGCATQTTGLGNRQHEIYWWTGPDGSKMLMKWYSLLGNTELGGYAEARNPSVAVDQATNKCGAANYPYDIAGAFGHGWDNLKTFTSAFVTVAQSKTNASRKVFVSNEHDFFEDFEATYGAGLPSLACSFGNEWDLYCASLAEVSARVKRAVEKLRGAEALATLVNLQNASFMTSRVADRDLAWMNLGLYWEHNWTADGPTITRPQRAAWQRGLASQIESYVNTLHGDAASALGGLIQKTGLNQRFCAFNPLSWTRTDVADFPYTGATPVQVIDLSTTLETPSQIVTIDGQQYLRILATDVPPVGYKVFEIQSGAGGGFSDAATVTGNVIENDFYQVAVADRGAITSLIDKTRLNREFVRNINGRDMNDLGPGSGSGSLQVENAGPVSVTLLATDTSPLAHSSRVTLIRNSNRVEIRNDITQNFGSVLTWGFGFEINTPEVWHEEVGAVIRAKLLADGGHYSPVNARYDWLTLNHFADIGDGVVGATLSNADCYFMRLGNSTVNTLDTTTPQLSPLVGGQVDGSNFGIPNQDGDTQFRQRFALQTHDAYDPVAAMRFALEHQNPLIVSEVTGGDAYPRNRLLVVDRLRSQRLVVGAQTRR